MEAILEQTKYTFNRPGVAATIFLATIVAATTFGWYLGRYTGRTEATREVETVRAAATREARAAAEATRCTAAQEWTAWRLKQCEARAAEAKLYQEVERTLHVPHR